MSVHTYATIENSVLPAYIDGPPWPVYYRLQITKIHVINLQENLLVKKEKRDKENSNLPHIIDLMAPFAPGIEAFDPGSGKNHLYTPYSIS